MFTLDGNAAETTFAYYTNAPDVIAVSAIGRNGVEGKAATFGSE
jgi:hypothetical protein